VRRGIIASRKPLLRHACMDLYHTTSGARMKPEIAQHYSTRRQLAQNGVLMSPVPQLLGDWTGRVAMCRATAARNNITQSAASDQASHEVALVLISLAPCSGARFPRSRPYSTVLPSHKRYGYRYEVEEQANQRQESDVIAKRMDGWEKSSTWRPWTIPHATCPSRGTWCLRASGMTSEPPCWSTSSPLSEISTNSLRRR
jgi:hypothetical protein